MKKVFGQKKVRIIFELSYMDVYYLLCTDFTEKKNIPQNQIAKSPSRDVEIWFPTLWDVLIRLQR